MSEREQNAIFSGAQGQAAIKTQTFADAAKQDFGVELGVELAPLPSQGKVYPVTSPLYDQSTVEITAMTAYHEDILANQALHKKGTVITELLRASLADKRIDPRSLLIGDRNALLITIRAKGYGTEYLIRQTCPECNETHDFEFNLGGMPVKTLDLEPVTPGSNEFLFVLPSLKKNVHFKYLTGADEEEIAATMQKQKKLGLSTDGSVTRALLYTLVSVDGVTDRGKIANFVKHCPAKDSAALRKYMKANEPGISMKQDVTCPACGHVESEVEVPLTAEFFWPGIS
jgi:hypothetical protein